MVAKNSKPSVVYHSQSHPSLKQTHTPAHTHTHTQNPLLVKEKVPTFVRILGIDAASRVTCTARDSGHRATRLAAAAGSSGLILFN